MSLSYLLSNFGFVVASVLFSCKKAEEYLNEAIAVANEMGAKGLLEVSSYERKAPPGSVDLDKLHNTPVFQNGMTVDVTPTDSFTRDPKVWR
jgi:hypothetical protein